jgi:hypothetical protein
MRNWISLVLRFSSLVCNEQPVTIPTHVALIESWLLPRRYDGIRDLGSFWELYTKRLAN